MVRAIEVAVKLCALRFAQVPSFFRDDTDRKIFGVSSDGGRFQYASGRVEFEDENHTCVVALPISIHG